MFKSFLSLMLKIIITSALSLSSWAGSKGVVVNIEVPGMSFQAKTAKIKGKVEKNGNTYKASNIYIKVKRLKTQMDLRDEHLHKKLNYKKFPKIIMTKGIAKGGHGKAIIEIKGIKKQIGFTYKDIGKIFIAKFALSLKSFGITGISYMGLGVKDKVIVEASVPIK